MLACRIHAKEDLRVEQADMPEVGPGEVLLKLGAGGICGSDLHYYFEGRNGSFVVREPLIPGHEASAVVAGVGPGVTRVKAGDKVAVSPSHACGRCEYCREGREQLCANMKFLGSASLFPHVQGMFSEYFVMGERQCYPVAGDVSLGELAFAEPLAVGLHAVNRGGELLGKSVLITGAGTIGCVTVQAARLGGARRITVSDILDRPLAQAKLVGADATLHAMRDVEALAKPQFDVAYEVSGSFAALKTCIAAVKRGGVVVQVGTLPHEPLPFVVNEIMAKEIDLRGAFRWGIEFDWAVDYLSTRRVDVRPLLSGQYPLQDAVAAFHAAADKNKSTKVQVIAV
jgi:L-idonate 5-dehydrogenase